MRVSSRTLFPHPLKRGDGVVKASDGGENVCVSSVGVNVVKVGGVGMGVDANVVLYERQQHASGTEPWARALWCRCNRDHAVLGLGPVSSVAVV